MADELERAIASSFGIILEKEENHPPECPDFSDLYRLAVQGVTRWVGLELQKHFSGCERCRVLYEKYKARIGIVLEQKDQEGSVPASLLRFCKVRKKQE